MWVNVAFTSVFAPFEEITPDEYQRVTEVSYLGYVYGTMAALKRMKPRDRGTIVQVGSALAYRGIPLQTAYCGAKHAIQGFHESLRCELLHDKSNVHVTMVQMPAVNTPQFSWVLSRLPHQAQPVPPIYQPEVAARGVLYAADHPGRREYWVGGSTVGTLAANAIAPGLLDRYLARTGLRPHSRRPGRAADRAGQPVGAGRRPVRPRLRRPRQLRRRSQAPQRPAVGLPASRPARRGGARWGGGRPGRRGGHRARPARPPVSVRAATLLAGAGGVLPARRIPGTACSTGVEEAMRIANVVRDPAPPPVHGIDRIVCNVRTGRFERSLSALTAAGALVTAAEIYFEHDSASFGNTMMWIPVALGPVGAAAGVAGFFSRRAAKTALPVASAAIVANGLQGTYLHARGIAQKPGGWSNVRYNMEMGPPLLAPLLVTMVGGMGLLAAILRREQ